MKLETQPSLENNKKAQLSLTNPRDAKAWPKIAPNRRAYNVVADNTGLSSFV